MGLINMIYLIMELAGLLLVVALGGFIVGWLLRGLDEREKQKYRR